MRSPVHSEFTKKIVIGKGVEIKTAKCSMCNALPSMEGLLHVLCLSMPLFFRAQNCKLKSQCVTTFALFLLSLLSSNNWEESCCAIFETYVFNLQHHRDSVQE